jgi:hypothetical protein
MNRSRSSGANSLPATPYILYFMDQKIHYCTNKGPPLLILLRQLNPVHSFIFSLLMMQVTIMPLSTSRSSKRSVSFRLCTLRIVLPSNATTPRPPSFDRNKNIWRKVQIRNHYITSFLQIYFTSSLLNPDNILCNHVDSVDVSHQVAHQQRLQVQS